MQMKLNNIRMNFVRILIQENVNLLSFLNKVYFKSYYVSACDYVCRAINSFAQCFSLQHVKTSISGLFLSVHNSGDDYFYQRCSNNLKKILNLTDNNTLFLVSELNIVFRAENSPFEACYPFHSQVQTSPVSNIYLIGITVGRNEYCLLHWL